MTLDSERPRPRERDWNDVAGKIGIAAGVFSPFLLLGIWLYVHLSTEAADQRAAEARAKAAAEASARSAALKAAIRGGTVPAGASVEDRAEHAICDGSWMRCYDDNDAFGNVSGRLVAELDASGAVTAAKYEKGDAPPAVRACMEKKLIGRSVGSFTGGAARVRCDYAGTYMSASNSSVHYNAAFMRLSSP